MILCHHGIKGQKWGVRRYQNKDGTLTKAGKERLTYRNNIIRNDPYSDDVNKIVNSLSDKEKKLLGASLNEDWRIKDSEHYLDQLTNISKTFAGSNALAKKFGFEQIDVPDEPGWENYNMYIRKTKSYKGE